MRKISLVSSSRADFGILKNLIIKIQKDKKINLNFYVTGSHLNQKFGNTLKEINKAKIKIKKKIPVKFEAGKDINVTKIISQTINNFSNEFKKNRPEILILLGDRYEIFSVAVAAMSHQIPIAHIHGGEITQGVIDEAIRHSITKMSHIHLVSTKKYYERVRQLGESKKFIFNVGSLGVENIKKMEFRSLAQIKKKFKITQKGFFVITLHPETLKPNDTKKNITILLESLKKFKKKDLIFTLPGADFNYKNIHKEVINFCKKNKNANNFKSLGQTDYLNLCKFADCVIGNSSSGIIEIPSLGVPSLDIGERQLGRVRAKTVIHSSFKKQSIVNSINRSLNLKKKILRKKTKIKNPYEKFGTSNKIINILKSINLKNIIHKSFLDTK